VRERNDTKTREGVRGAQHNLEDEKGAEEKDHYGVDKAAKRGAEASRKRRQVYSRKIRSKWVLTKKCRYLKGGSACAYWVVFRFGSRDC
jgi:hypothetical protein